VGFCDGQKWRWGRFSPRTSVSPANLRSISRHKERHFYTNHSLQTELLNFENRIFVYETDYIPESSIIFMVLPTTASLKLVKRREASREFIDPLIKYQLVLFVVSAPLLQFQTFSVLKADLSPTFHASPRFIFLPRVALLLYMVFLWR
jgi:hypothetical protein